MYLGFPCAPKSNDSRKHGKLLLWQSVVLIVADCDSCCSLANMLVEADMFVFGPAFAVLGHEVFGNWIVHYAFTFAFDVIFQYAAKVAMSKDSKLIIWWQTFKTDFPSIISRQIRRYVSACP